MMRRIYYFLCLPAADRSLFVKALALLAAIQLGLWLLPFQTLRRLLTRLSRPSGKDRDPTGPAPARVAWAVRRASRYVPLSACLARALAAQVLLGRYRYPATFHIGVAIGRAGRLEAHAWIECRGQIVVGNLADLSRYKPLPSLEVEHT